jgi:hypothetical protein
MAGRAGAGNNPRLAVRLKLDLEAKALGVTVVHLLVLNGLQDPEDEGLQRKTCDLLRFYLAALPRRDLWAAVIRSQGGMCALNLAISDPAGTPYLRIILDVVHTTPDFQRNGVYLFSLATEHQNMEALEMLLQWNVERTLSEDGLLTTLLNMAEPRLWYDGFIRLFAMPLFVEAINRVDGMPLARSVVHHPHLLQDVLATGVLVTTRLVRCAIMQKASTSVLRLLLDQRPTVMIEDHNSHEYVFSTFSFAVTCNRGDVIRMVLDAGISVDHKDMQTALYQAFTALEPWADAFRFEGDPAWKALAHAGVVYQPGTEIAQKILSTVQEHALQDALLEMVNIQVHRAVLACVTAGRRKTRRERRPCPTLPSEIWEIVAGFAKRFTK